jgi:hypothetical protein
MMKVLGSKCSKAQSQVPLLEKYQLEALLCQFWVITVVIRSLVHKTVAITGMLCEISMEMGADDTAQVPAVKLVKAISIGRLSEWMVAPKVGVLEVPLQLCILPIMEICQPHPIVQSLGIVLATVQIRYLRMLQFMALVCLLAQVKSCGVAWEEPLGS